MIEKKRSWPQVHLRDLAAPGARVVQNNATLKGGRDATLEVRAPGMPGARCTRGLVRKIESTRVSHHRFAGTPGIPCAIVLTAYSALLCPQNLPECANGRF
jgi:hypothetical protein